MALHDATNIYRSAGSFTPSCILPSKYRPLICRGQKSVNQPSRLDFPALRLAGNCNLDLWLDGQIYPKHPVDQTPPKFHDLKSFLCFLGDGVTGFYGYVQALHNGVDGWLVEYMSRCCQLAQQLQELSVEHNAIISQLHAEKNALQNALASSESQVSFVLTHLHDLGIRYESQIEHLRVEIAKHIEDKSRHVEETNAEVTTLIATHTKKIKYMELCHSDQLQDVHIELLKTKNDLAQLQLKCTRSLKILQFNYQLVGRGRI